MNIIDYITWRGDLTFSQVPINEVDSLIFTCLCYETFDDILTSPMTLNELGERFFKKYQEVNLKKRVTLTSHLYEVLKACMYTRRYGDLMVSDFVNEIDETKDLQFSAMTFSYKKDFKYIAYRGTDDTIVGWKEDFMLAYKDEILSEKKAKEYLLNILNKHSPFSKTKYYLGGHSKGGHLAMYACKDLPKKWHSKIQFIHNFDGPGFKPEFYDNNAIKALQSKMTTYIPPSSFFGRMFSHQGETLVLNSEQIGLLQHNPLFWHVQPTTFDYELSVSEGSNKALVKFNELMNTYDLKQLETIIESLFSIFKQLNIAVLADLLEINLMDIITSLKFFNDLDGDTKKVVKELLLMILNITEITVHKKTSE